jgi:plasmid maintenance system antidote protein VapI
MSLPAGARALRKAIWSRGLTQKDAGELVGVTANTIYRWIHGHTAPPHELIARLEVEFGIGHRLWLRHENEHCRPDDDT